MNGFRLGGEEWMNETTRRIFADMTSGVFWDNALNKDPIHTAKNSHIDRHVGKTAVELLNRGFTDPLFGPGDSFSVSTFTDNVPVEAYLEDIITTMLTWAPDSFCDLVMSEQDTRMALRVATNPADWRKDFAVMQPCITMEKDGFIREKLTNVVRVVFRRDIDSEYGFHIVTAFPDLQLSADSEKLLLIKPKKGQAKRLIRETRRDLTPELVQTEYYRKASPARRAFLRGVASPITPRLANRIAYDPGDDRYKPSIKVWFPATNGNGEYFARVSEERTIVEPSSKDSRAERLDFSNLEDWVKVHKLNGVAARFS